MRPFNKIFVSMLISLGLFLSLITTYTIAKNLHTTLEDIQNHSIHTHLTKDQWLEDLESLNSLIRNHHINPFWHKDETGYINLFYAAHDYILQTSKIDSNQVNAYFEKMVAYISDGHSYVVNKTARFGAFPFRVEWYGEKLFLVATDKENQQYLGAEVIAFNRNSIAQTKVKITPFIPVVNSSSFKFNSRDVYSMGGLLQAAGIIKESNNVTLTVKLRNNKIINKKFNLVQQNNSHEWVYLHETNGIDVPLYRQEKESNQWLYFFEKESVLYIRYAAVIDNKPGDIKILSKNITQLLNTQHINKIIVDIRNNGGGDSYLNAPLINAIASNDAINKPGKVFVLTNHNTFSAAINFAGNMEMKTAALFVGEKVGDSASFAGESGPQALYRLPNSNIAVSLSFSEWNSTYDNDQSDALRLDIPVELSLDDVLQGRDPVLDAALHYQVPPTQYIQLPDNIKSTLIGRYDYSADKALKIFEQDNELHIEITELAFSRLYAMNNNEYKTDIKGIEFKRHKNGDLELIQMGQHRLLRKLSDSQLKPLEMLMAGQFEKAKSAYQLIYKKNPRLLSIRGNSLGILASNIREKYNNQLFYDQLREIAISLHGYPVDSWEDE